MYEARTIPSVFLNLKHIYFSANDQQFLKIILIYSECFRFDIFNIDDVVRGCALDLFLIHA